MDAPVKDLESMKILLENAKKLLIERDYKGAEAGAREVLELDPHSVKAFKLLGDIYEAIGHITEAKQHRKMAEEIKKERWMRQVESEIRGKHEILGTPLRRELP